MDARPKHAVTVTAATKPKAAGVSRAAVSRPNLAKQKRPARWLQWPERFNHTRAAVNGLLEFKCRGRHFCHKPIGRPLIRRNDEMSAPRFGFGIRGQVLCRSVSLLWAPFLPSRFLPCLRAASKLDLTADSSKPRRGQCGPRCHCGHAGSSEAATDLGR